MSEKDEESKEAFRRRMEDDLNSRFQAAINDVAREKGVHPIIVQVNAVDFLRRQE